mmetsp:Transcript_11895/g.25109  ORF Transcript_11895/g.25109 Transcript_11895/m.25109 type:complete len:211 (+) Transcript_11895:818-1450(+)
MLLARDVHFSKCEPGHRFLPGLPNLLEERFRFHACGRRIRQPSQPPLGIANVQQSGSFQSPHAQGLEELVCLLGRVVRPLLSPRGCEGAAQRQPRGRPPEGVPELVEDRQSAIPCRYRLLRLAMCEMHPCHGVQHLRLPLPITQLAARRHGLLRHFQRVLEILLGMIDEHEAVQHQRLRPGRSRCSEQFPTILRQLNRLIHLAHHHMRPH